MKLSAEQFAELASTFSAQGSPVRHDRRRANRMDLRAKVRMTPIVSGQRLASSDVMACDFSARGIAFLLPNQLQSGVQFITHLPRRSGGIVELLCTVMHCEQLKGNLYRIGAEFTCTIQQQDRLDQHSEHVERERIRESMLR